MTIAIMATGDEIIQGDTLNTNTHGIAHALTSEGLSIGLHLSCSDNEASMIECLKFISQRHDIIILIGGLGPTSDDRTRFALAAFLKVTLIVFPEALAHIKARLARAKLLLNAGNRQQALFPKGAILLPNPNGTAMGCIYRSKNKCFVLLPGPPRECISMFNEYVLPVLQQTAHRCDTQVLKWRLFGVAEGQIAEMLDAALSHVDAETGYRLETPYLEFKVRCKAHEVLRVQEVIAPLVLPYMIAPPEEKASERLCRVITAMKVPVVIIDEVTGGLLQGLIQRPSNYRWLTFHDTGKSKLYFHLTGLDEFWLNLACESAMTTLMIQYHDETKDGSESHQIPYRGAFVVDYAAEWLCFRILHLIDQLHQ